MTLNLDEFQKRQAETKKRSADESVDLRIKEAYHWLLVPGQPDPKGDVSWTDLKLQGQDSLATRAAKKLKSEESLLVQMGAVRLRTELDRVPLWTGNHVGIKQLCEYMARYLYLPRLRDEQVLIAAIQEGVSNLVWSETFAYAEGWDEQRRRYMGLKAGTNTRIIVDDRSLLVKPEIAAEQIEKEQQAAQATMAGATGISGNGTSSGSTSASTINKPSVGVHPAETVVTAKKLARFHPSPVSSAPIISRCLTYCRGSRPAPNHLGRCRGRNHAGNSKPTFPMVPARSSLAT